jgi:Flp pilus assembly pilin Flp
MTVTMTLQTLGRRLRRLRHDARGLTTVEYTIVLCLIAALCVGVWKQFGDQVEGHISGSKDKIATPLNEALQAQ